MFFLRKLVIFGAALTEDEYDLVNETFAGDGSPLIPSVVEKLLEIDKVPYSEDLLSTLSEIEGAGDVIKSLQERFLPAIQHPMVHLCDVNSQTMSIVHTASFRECERYFMRYVETSSDVPLTLQIVVKYLSHSSLQSTYFSKTLSSGVVNYNAVLNYVRENVECLVVVENLVSCMYERAANSLIPEIVEMVHRNAKHTCRCTGYLAVLRRMLLKGGADREELEFMYRQLVYLDAAPEVRTSAVFPVLGLIIRNFGKLDRAIMSRADTAQPGDSGEGHVLVGSTSLVSDTARNTYDRNAHEVQKLNSCVLSAMLWPEICEIRGEASIPGLVGVLTDIVASTGAFYSGRLQGSGLLEKLLNFYEAHFPATERSSPSLSNFVVLLTLISRNLRLTKRSFGRIFRFLRGFDVAAVPGDIASSLARQDKYHFFYLCVTHEDHMFSARMKKELCAFERRRTDGQSTSNAPTAT